MGSVSSREGLWSEEELQAAETWAGRERDLLPERWWEGDWAPPCYPCSADTFPAAAPWPVNFSQHRAAAQCHVNLVIARHTWLEGENSGASQTLTWWFCHADMSTEETCSFLPLTFEAVGNAVCESGSGLPFPSGHPVIVAFSYFGGMSAGLQVPLDLP